MDPKNIIALFNKVEPLKYLKLFPEALDWYIFRNYF